MKNFEYYAPTKVFFGKGVEEQIGEIIVKYGYKKVLIHYGSGSIKASGLYDIIVKSVEDAGVSYCELGGVEANPKLGLVRQGIELAKQEKVDFILAVGGGSVIDSSKAIGLGLANDADPWYMIENTGEFNPPKGFPIGVVLTLAAAGSEMSDSCVITNEETNLKRGINAEVNRPIFAFMNPELTYTVSDYQTSCGIVDIMMHTLERYFSPDKGVDLTDRIAEGLLIAVKDAGPIALLEPNNYDARATLMWASSLSHNDLTGLGKKKIMPAHRISHELSGFFDIAHGAALSVIFPAWAKYEYKKDLGQFVQFATRVWGIEPDFDNLEKTALEGIESMKSYFSSLGMPVSLRELDIDPKDYEMLVDNTTNKGTVELPSYDTLTKSDVLEIYKLAE